MFYMYVKVLQKLWCVSCYFQSYDCVLNIESLEKKLIHVEEQERYDCNKVWAYMCMYSCTYLHNVLLKTY